MTPQRDTTVSTHVLDTSAGHPAAGITVELSVRSGDEAWSWYATSATDQDGRCADFPAVSPDARLARLRFAVAPYLAQTRGRSFFPQVTVEFALATGEHHHVPLLLNPFGYSTYRGS
ncbi:5-hydroxyisourate hydrolase [Wenjunlia vitaminophila]|uniref:5-hydroxyisourate hydrolase n=1 Tax=Wenjunlia vitaminophila TaxID=76728 RepID=A0A0T6LZB9_WENVI|nr:hydroxyisourate hydrolase [Wenjunlia vitaminophila]KRV51321.1 5-hydroxyisourate hydrolase [Wenjunlia vitaminophila]